jgi:hypothetical protein
MGFVEHGCFSFQSGGDFYAHDPQSRQVSLQMADALWFCGFRLREFRVLRRVNGVF